MRIFEAPFGRTQSPFASAARDSVEDAVTKPAAKAAAAIMDFSIMSSQSGKASVYGNGMYTH